MLSFEKFYLFYCKFWIFYFNKRYWVRCRAFQWVREQIYHWLCKLLRYVYLFHLERGSWAIIEHRKWNLLFNSIIYLFNITATADVPPSPDPSRELQAPASQRESDESNSLESFERPKDLVELYQNLFSEEQTAASKFHYYWKCTENGCSELSSKEKARIKKIKQQDICSSTIGCWNKNIPSLQM